MALTLTDGQERAVEKALKAATLALGDAGEAGVLRHSADVEAALRTITEELGKVSLILGRARAGLDSVS